MASPSPSWQVAMANGWEAVPAHELLQSHAPVWQQNGLSPLPRAEAASFAAFARLLQYGQSMALVLPMPSSATFARLLSFAHRLRMDAVDGGIRATWLQPAKMLARSDIVVLTRPSARHSAWAKVSDLHALSLRPGVPAPEPGNRLRTVLVDGNTADLMVLFSLLERATRPFLFVIDGTGAGVGESTAHLQALLQEYFPLVPSVSVLAAGDASALDKMQVQPLRAHLWRWRKGDDAVAVGGAAAQAGISRVELACLADEVADRHLAAAAMALRGLTAAAEKEAPLVRQKIVAPLYKVFNQLRTLALPLECLEQELLAATHGGRFPVMMLRRWLDTARQADFRYADTGAAVTAAVQALDAAYAVMDGAAITGKTQAVLACVKKAAAERRALTVLVGSAFEAGAVERWLDRMVDLEGLPQITVRPMDGVRVHSKPLPDAGDVLVTGVLWPNRLPWLGLPVAEVVLPAYPFEVDVLRRQLGRWWEQCGRASLPDGDKLRLWQLNWPPHGRCLDAQTDPQSAAAIIEGGWPHAGSYRKQAKSLSISVPNRYADWIDVLLAEHERAVDDGAEHGSAHDVSRLVWLHVSGAAQPIPWPCERPVLVLEKDDLAHRLPEDLAAGDRIVLLHYNDERLATQAALFQVFCAESDGMEEILRFASKWQALVDEVSRRLGTVAAMRAMLKRAGITVTDQTIQNWRRHRVLGPENPHVIEVFAAESGHKTPARHAKKVANAIDAVRKERRRIGRDLNAALLAHARGVDEVHIGSLKLDAAAFASMVGVCEVEEVVLPQTSEPVPTPGLQEVAARIEQRYPGRLMFTPAAQRSMRQSGFKDVERFGSCLELMASRLWPMYHDGVERMHELLPDFEAKNISFAPGTASTTQGRFRDYDRTYKGKPVDIGRHFKIGTAWDTVLTMRIHFHWDDEDRQIVIHHAGEHLKTTIS